MSRLPSGFGPSDRPALGTMLALAGLAAALGCAPANSTKPSAKDSADNPAAQRSEDDRSAAARNSQASDRDDLAPPEASRRSAARGPITVDSEGYVTLDPKPGSPGAAADEVAATRSAAATESQSELVPREVAKPEVAASEVAKPEFATAEAPSLKADAPQGAAAAPADAEPRGSEIGGEPTPAQPQVADAQPAASDASEPEPAKASVKAELVKSNAASLEGKKSVAEAHAADSGLASYDEKHQEIAKDWPKPQALLFITGQQHGYIEPCGCTGLENQKGGLNRRDTLLKQLADRGWDVLPMDVGNFERRAGRQAEIKFQTTVDALKDMHYRAATLGIDDLKLSSTHLLSLTATEGKTETPFISSNAYILIEEYMPKSKIIEVGGRKIGVTAVLGDSFRAELKGNGDVVTTPAAESLSPVVAQLKKAGCDYTVLLAHATLEESQQLAKDVPGFDLVVTSGGYPEPFYQLEDIPGSQSKLAQVGAKGMYTVLVGLYPDSDQPVRYQRVALSSQFPDSPRMLERFANYQKQLQSLGFEGLGLRASTFPEGRKFVGSETCGQCHTKAFEVWKDSQHATATESLVHPPNDRGMIPRHFDPECISCHVTGWNAKSYFPYASGYTSLEETPMLTGSGCENCHGPGSKHVAAENGDVEADSKLLDELRAQMRLPLSEAKARCLDCHDQDNSPDFQHEGAFEKYWAEIAHPGKD